MKVHLISYTEDPIGTLLAVWRGSKEPGSFDDVLRRKAGARYDSYAKPAEEDLEEFRRIIRQGIPVAEHITFNFWLEDVPIAWREQSVRHRVGYKHGDNFAVDIVPDDDTTWWSQSMRLLDMSSFADDDRYFTPPSIAEDEAALSAYEETMQDIQAAYRNLLALGVPMEDARGVIPLHATHGIALTTNLRALQHVIGKRSCWILQSTLWGPIISGIIDCLASEIHPVFRELVHPPCVSAGKFVGCVFELENERRVTGDDPLPVCPLYATQRGYEPSTGPYTAAIQERIPEYARLWGQPKLGKTWRWEESEG